MRAPLGCGALFDLSERSGAITDQVQTTETVEEFKVEYGETDPWQRRLLDAEPSRIAGLVTAVLVLLIAFGAPISVEQKASILGVVAALLAVVQGEVTRNAVYSPATVADLDDAAAEAIERAYEAGTEDAAGGSTALADIG